MLLNCWCATTVYPLARGSSPSPTTAARVDRIYGFPSCPPQCISINSHHHHQQYRAYLLSLLLKQPISLNQLLLVLWRRDFEHCDAREGRRGRGVCVGGSGHFGAHLVGREGGGGADGPDGEEREGRDSGDEEGCCRHFYRLRSVGRGFEVRTTRPTGRGGLGNADAMRCDAMRCRRRELAEIPRKRTGKSERSVQERKTTMIESRGTKEGLAPRRATRTRWRRAGGGEAGDFILFHDRDDHRDRNPGRGRADAVAYSGLALANYRYAWRIGVRSRNRS